MFDIPAEFQEKLKNSMKDNSTVRLSFAAPTMWWMNGKMALKNTKQVEDATRFGGWGITRDEVDNFGSELAEVPTYWQLHPDLSNNSGGSYSAYLCRTAWVAPIARRYGWFTDKSGRSGSKLNVLCYLATMQQDRTLLPYGPVVLSAKSLTCVDLDKCFKEFAAKTASIRGGTLPNYFYHPIGTWGAEPIFTERKSKGGASSSVTPPQLYQPKEGGYKVETLQKWFVSVEVVEEMGRLYDLAQDWVNDWKNRKTDKAEVEQAPDPDLTIPPEEDFPF
jgi:hypothetical protein